MKLSLVIVRHALEARKLSNSGRLAADVLPSAEIHAYGDPGRPLDQSCLVHPHSWLLYPEGPLTPAPPQPPIEQLIVLDGTWPQARRMRQRIAALRGMPILRVEPPTQTFTRLRKTAVGEQLPTAIAIAAALELLGEPAAAESVRGAWRDLVAQCQADGRLV